MALPFLSSRSRRPDQIVAIDLGTRTSKAVYVQRKGEAFTLANYATKEAPQAEKGVNTEHLAEHLKAMAQALGARTKQTILVLGVTDSFLRPAELPLVSPSDMRMMLKYNAKKYLQEDLQDYVFDCYILPPKLGEKPGESMKASQKCKVLVAGAKKKLVDEIEKSIREAGLTPEQIVPDLICLPNAFERAQPDAYAKEVVALVDIGFKNTTITMLLNGELALTRVVGIGGDKLTSGLAETMGIGYAEAEGIKVGMAGEVQSNLEPLLTPLGRELRASIDFFEHQQDKTVSQIYISGGTAASEFIVQTLQTELMAPCKGWNPSGFLTLALPPKQMAEMEQVGSQLSTAIGAAMSAF